MENIQLYAGLKLKDKNNLDWRIIFTDRLSCLLIRMNISKREIVEMNTSELLSLIDGNEISIASDQGHLIMDKTKISKSRMSDFLVKKEFMTEVAKLYGPSYYEFSIVSPKKEFISLYEKYGYSKALANKLVTRWLQSGFQDISLLSYVSPKKRSHEYRKKTGAPSSTSGGIIVTDEIREQFDYGIDLYKRNKKVTKTDAYVNVLYRYYTTLGKDGKLTLLPPEQIPTRKQFIYYMDRHISKDEEQLIKTSRDEFYNDHRLLFGFNRASAVKPGYIVEVDALEVDINVVSTFNKQQNISRPIIYMMTDLYSHAIVAFHVGFDNNSMLGLSSLMMNLFDDKKRLCEAHGITNADLDAWPSCFIPNEIRCDRGADFASVKFADICRNLNITRSLEHGATGSMKGLIEQSFRQFHQQTLPLLEHQGVILKRYDSNHKKSACLTIEQIFYLVVSFIIRHNRQYVSTFSLTKDMRESGVKKDSVSIWNYGVQKCGLQTPITPANYQNAIYYTMPEDTGHLCREGVRFRGLLYRCNTKDVSMVKAIKLSQINAGKKNTAGVRLNAIRVHFDPRSINEIYYLNEGLLSSLHLDPDKNDGIENITWDEYEDYCKEKKLLNKEGIARNLEERIAHTDFILKMAKDAIQPTYASSENIKAFRNLERNDQNYRNRVSNRIISDKEVYELEKKETTTAEILESKEASIISQNVKAVVVKEKDKNSSSKDNLECPQELCSFLDD